MFVRTRGALYCFERTVLRAGAQWETLATVEMYEPVFATPAFVDNRMFVRTRGALYCFEGE